MSIEPINLIGGGGHAKVVADALLSGGQASLCVFDSDPKPFPLSFLGQYEAALFIPEAMAGKNCHVAIGSNEVREKVSLELSGLSAVLVTVKHPNSSVSRFAEISRGCFVAARAIIGPGATVGAGTIINHAAVIDHDCTIGIYCHVAPGAVLGGGVTVGDNCLVGAGAIVLPGVSVGAGVTIGAGAVVTKNVPSNSTWAGVPATAMELIRNA